ncbi:MAG: radical SAM protein [Methanosarcinales archaeon]|nr:radical SAM protein [Methanosarcinales archaeon]
MTTAKFEIYSNLLFKVHALIDDGLVKTRITGLAAPVLNHFLHDMLSIFDGKVPVRVTDDTLYFSTWMPPIPSLAYDRLVRSQTKNMIAQPLWKFGIPASTNPEQVTISITEECPNRCIHCALPDTKHKTSLSIPAIKDIIDQSVNMGATQIIFDGGEPMVYDGLEELVAHVPDGAISTVFTSGSGLTREKAQALADAGLYAVNVSLDSPKEGEHDRIRGREGVFNDAMAGIGHCLDAGLLVDIYVVVAPHNIHDLDGFYELAESAGVHELSFYEIVPTGRWMDREKDILSPAHHQLLDEFVERRKCGPVKVFSIPDVMKNTGCFAGRRWLHVTPQGNVLPCACIPITYGNIYKEPLKDIWRRIQKTGIYRSQGCLMRDDVFRAEHLRTRDLEAEQSL